MRKLPRPNTKIVRAPALDLVKDVVAPKILAAAVASSEQLSRAGVRHALIGGLAVGAWGYPRATKDVDFLVGDEAFVHHAGGLVTIASGVPFAVGNVAVDTLSIGEHEAFLETTIGVPSEAFIPVASLESIVYLKLKSPRKKDEADIVELAKRGSIDAVIRRRVSDFATIAGAPELVEKFYRLLEDAEREET